LRELLTRQALGEGAHGSAYSFGRRYLQKGGVSDLTAQKNVVSANVRGWDLHQVELWVVDGRLSGRCPCPVGSDGRFCEHIVAVGLAWLERRGRGVQVSGYRLQGRSRAGRMPDQRRDAAQPRPVKTVPGSIRVAIDDVTSPHRAGLRYQTARQARKLNSVLDTLEQMLAAGNAAAVVEMAAYGLERAGGVRGWRYDPDQGFEQVDSQFLSLHVRACAVAKPDPADLARWLFHFELSSARAAWEGVFIRYVGLLGDKGLAVYRELAAAEWRARPSPRDEGSRLQEVVCHAALLTVDPELLSEVARTDFSLPWTYHVTARQCVELGLPDKAVAWAELGVRTFPAAPHPGLRELLADEYARRGRMTEALSQVWAQFTEGLRIEDYRRLRSFAQKAEQAAVWRDEALEYLRERTARSRAAGSAEQRERWRCGSLLVEILLNEKNVEAAWREAHISGCDGEVWLKLARAREAKHPADAVRIYQQLAEQVVQHAGDFEYRAAVRYLRRAAGIITRLGQPKEFREYLAGYRERNKRKKNLLRLINREFGP
jgi:hypothetical protein